MPAVFHNLHAQSGGKKREGRSKSAKRGKLTFKRNPSKGHADEFARGGRGRRGKFYMLFHQEKPAWQYKPTNSGRRQNRESRFLFFRSRSEGIEENERILNKQNAKRANKRVHGNNTIAKKKYKRTK